MESSTPSPYKYDEEHIITLSDFFNKTDTEIETGLTSSNFTWSGETTAVLVNGQGRLATNATGSCKLGAIDIKPGKTYRLRFIGATALSFVWLGIESHDMSIIEADGHYTKPVDTNFLQISTGQRYSVLLKAKTEDELKAAGKRQFYIQLTTLERPTVLTTFAVLKYPGASGDLTTVPSKPPLPIANTTYGWLDYQLHPFYPDTEFPTLAEVTRRITVKVHQNISDHIVWLENGYPWTDAVPRSPYLVDIYEGKYNAEAAYKRAIANGNGLDNITRTFPAKLNEVLEIVWQNEGAFTSGGLDTHPFHGHGRHFYDIGGGDGLYDVAANEERLKNGTPATRDTTVLYRYRTSTTPLAPSGWRAWRIKVTDPGVWMMHCHILQHMIMGMQTVFTFGDLADIVARSGPVDNGYLTYGGSAYGNGTHWPAVQHFFDQ